VTDWIGPAAVHSVAANRIPQISFANSVLLHVIGGAEAPVPSTVMLSTRFAELEVRVRNA